MQMINKIIFEIRMYIMDVRWTFSLDYNSWAMYPPSFYHRYTPEEQKQIKERDLAKIRKIISELEKSREKLTISTE